MTTVTAPSRFISSILVNTTSSLHAVNDPDNRTSSATIFFNINAALWLAAPPVLLVLGCFGNVMTIVVMRGMRASESTACLSVYFTALAVSDLCLLTSSLLWYWPPQVFDMPLWYFNDVSCTVLFFVFYVASLTSAWFLVAMTCQRMTSVVVPHRVGLLCTVRRGKFVTAGVVVTSCVANVNIFFNYHVEYVDNDYGVCVSTDESVANIFRLIDLSTASVIPFLVLLVSNSVLVSRAMQSARLSRQIATKNDHRSKRRSAQFSSMTTTLTLTSVAFLLLTLPTCVFDVYLELIGYHSLEIVDETLDAKLTLVNSVFILMWIGNSAVNFYIYILSGSKFRQETKRQLCLCFKGQPRSTLDAA
ncbi:hypothetical protein ACOMHN_040191 [Nucella lapillus]